MQRVRNAHARNAHARGTCARHMRVGRRGAALADARSELIDDEGGEAWCDAPCEVPPAVGIGMGAEDIDSEGPVSMPCACKRSW